MADIPNPKVAIVYPGDEETRRHATPENNRLATVFQALANLGVGAEPVVYYDEVCEDVRRQLSGVKVALVWINPIQDGRDRSVLDAMLRDVSAKGVHVSAHPDIILKMGTKEVLYRTRAMAWGCDTHLYEDMDALRRELPMRLASGGPRVLKQYRGNGGAGVWKVAWAGGGGVPQPETLLRVRHAKRGSIEEDISLHEFFSRCEPYFEGRGRMVDQAYQERLAEGMVRCYLVQDKIVGFGHQAINALYPAPGDAPASEAPQPGPRLYHPPDMPDFQVLKRKVEQEWVPAMQRILDIDTEDLPILWDCDFLFGPKQASGEDTYVLCEINASSVAPYPETAPHHMAEATLGWLQAAVKKDG